MPATSEAALHDAYASEYDDQVKAYNCFIGDVLFGLCYEYTQQGKRLLDAGIGSGLAALPFAKAGLQVSGMDFSPAMLEICRAKGFATDLKEHDIQEIPWPYQSENFDILICCGVMHFICNLEGVFYEAARLLPEGGIFAFTIRNSPLLENVKQEYVQQNIGGFEIYSHASVYLLTLLHKFAFQSLKMQKCFVGEDVFTLWIVKKSTPI